ncbi:hypothetical protein MMC07_001305 [Pseudocyphellaria aurata]|nr:hypothetical protein [Pseudocyphellaria aurata]
MELEPRRNQRFSAEAKHRHKTRKKTIATEQEVLSFQVCLSNRIDKTRLASAIRFDEEDGPTTSWSPHPAAVPVQHLADPLPPNNGSTSVEGLENLTTSDADDASDLQAQTLGENVEPTAQQPPDPRHKICPSGEDCGTDCVATKETAVKELAASNYTWLGAINAPSCSTKLFTIESGKKHGDRKRNTSQAIFRANVVFAAAGTFARDCGTDYVYHGRTCNRDISSSNTYLR